MRRRLDRALTLLQSRIPLVEIRWTQRRGDAQQWAGQAAAANAALVIGFGGDGTLNEIANGLVGSNTPLGILPAGTGNVLASELDIPRDPLAAAHALLAGRIEYLSIGRAQFSPPASSSSSQPAPLIPHYFLFSAGIGFDATVCGRITPALKRCFGRGAYIFDGLREYARYRSPRLQVSLDGGVPAPCSELVIANGHYYAGRFVIAPDASPRDANLDVCLFTRPGRWNLLRYALAIIVRRHTRLPDVLCRKVQSLDVTADRAVPLQLDGDTVGTTPARFTVCPQALAVVTPAPA